MNADDVRTIRPIFVRPRTPEERTAIEKAAKAAGVTEPTYVLGAALTAARGEGADKPPWHPRPRGQKHRGA